MAKSTEAPPQETAPAEFPQTVTEFLSEVSDKQVETKTAFAKIIGREPTTHKTRTEWQRLYDLFRAMPVGARWDEWIASDKGGK